MPKVIIYALAGIAVLVVAAIALLTAGLSAGKNVQVGAIDFSRLKDGVYTGAHRAGRWTNEVQVKVESGRVSDIRVTKDVMFPKPEWTEQTMKSVIERQTLQVDVISGATVTMKVYLKSIENALEKAK